MPAGEGGGVWWNCFYEWSDPATTGGSCDEVDAKDKLQQGDCCYTFGPTVETSEHCNVFLYYYPKTEDITCF